VRSRIWSAKSFGFTALIARGAEQPHKYDLITLILVYGVTNYWLFGETFSVKEH